MKDKKLFPILLHLLILLHYSNANTTIPSFSSPPSSSSSSSSQPSTTDQNSILTTTTPLTTNVQLEEALDKNTSSSEYPQIFSKDDNLVPTKPLNLSVLEVTSTTIKIQWREPSRVNGAIIGYRVFLLFQNETILLPKSLKSDISAGPFYTYIITDLKPYSEYKVSVKAFTFRFEGEVSDPIYQRTDVTAPSAPIVVNLTCHTQDDIYLKFRRPRTYYNSIDFYIISYRPQGANDFSKINLNSTIEHLEFSMVIPNLTTNTVYEVKVKAATLSTINPKQLILGSYSDLRKITLQPNCDKIQSLLRQSNDDINFALVGVAIISLFGIVLIVFALLLWKKCFHAAYYYLDDPPCQPQTLSVDWEAPVEVGGELRTSIPAIEFAKHVAELHVDGDIGFSKEYETIQNESISDEYASEHSQHPDNKGKNRYLNIIAYDHSRVHLRQMPGQKKHIDYINANYIDGYQRSRAFIGTQGPLPGTFDCFWRMIWEQRVSIIVMITNLVERGRRKCDMYWPKDGCEQYGVIQVKLIQEDVMATYTVRTFQIKHLKLKKKKQAMTEKLVYQYHYTNWQDHGTDHPLPVLNFVKKSAAANPSDGGPIVVHCSAGVGRTGTYIVLDAMLKQIENKGVVNVFGFLRHIRAQRNFLVQTEEQYIFIHDALVEAISSGETNIKMDRLLGCINDLEFLDRQFKLISSFQPKEVNMTSAIKQVNGLKNRSTLYPLEGSRVHLTPKPGVEGSDYINATWLNGFRRLRDYIVTQHPLTSTIKDFWQMVWDHNCQTVVLLSSIDGISFTEFWPLSEHDSIESDYYRIRMVNEICENDYVIRNFVIESQQDDYELNVRMLHCATWPDLNNPRLAYDFIIKIHERSHDYRNGPIVVVDRYGGIQACTFCIISSLSMQLEYDQTSNIYTYSKLYHNKRPGIWQSYDDIRQIYKILSYIPPDFALLKYTQLRTEFDDLAMTTATPDLYSKICSNGSLSTHLNNSNNNTNGGAVIVKMNSKDNDDLSCIVTTTTTATPNIDLDNNKTK